MKLTKRTFTRVFLVGFSAILMLFIYAKNSWRYKINEEQLEELIVEIENADKLPKIFYELYEKEFDLRLSNGTITNTFLSIFDSDAHLYPSYVTARYQINPTSINTNKRRYQISNYGLAMKLDEKLSQEQCLNWNFQNHEFSITNEVKGIDKASRYFFGKNKDSLSYKETAILILLFRNAALYNPKRNPEGVKKKIEKLLDKKI